MPDLSVRLRPFRGTDLEVLDRFATDPAFSEPFEWTGFRFSEGYRHRWEEDGFLEGDPHMLVVADDSDAALGWVMWRDAMLGGEEGVGGWLTGILLAPEHRGRGIGSIAQRLLAEHLFSTTTAHRISAYTEADNLPEQGSLEKAGFCREGVLRGAAFRGGDWRDLVVYSRVRGDA